MKIASGAGIGLFLTIIGLSRSAGIGAINAGGTATPLELGGCTDEFFDTKVGVCVSHKMMNPQVSRNYLAYNN